jgi:branched-chain amino acid transport system ATP-binding protein
VALLEIDGLSVAYGAVAALRGISLSVEEREIVTLIGANGAGKSTTLRAISGLLEPVSGRISFDGRDIVGLRPDQILRLGLVHVPEGRGIFTNLSVHENLELGAYARRDAKAVAADRARVFELFPRLAERQFQNAGTLSGGEQQMLAIGRALLARPRLLLLDEPSLGLAPRLVQSIFRVLRDINEAGTTLLLVEQNAHMALQIAHHAHILEVGSLVRSGAARELAASDEVRKAYLGGY